MNALGLVVAAGLSTRMGGFPKPLLEFDGDRFVERIIDAYADAGVDTCLVVLGHEHAEVRERADFRDATVVVNDEYEAGMLSSVQCGVREAQKQDVEAMFLWPVDFPCSPPAIVETLWDTYQETNADVVIPTVDGDRGHPALFAASTFEGLLHAPDDVGARAVVYDDEIDVVDVPVDDPRIHVDIDTPSEYWDAVRRYA